MPRCIRTAVACITISIGGIALAGDLNPPPGPVAPTMKPLDIVEPRTPISQATTPGDATHTFIITASGSYYLTSDTQCAPGKMGLFIAADDVTVDLSGFTLRGDSTGGSTSGIGTLNERTGCAIRNGVITGFAYGSTQARFHKSTFEDLRVYNNPAGGLEWSGLDRCIFRRLIIESAAELGLNAGERASVEGCVITGGFTGILAGSGSRVSGCTVANCGTGIESLSGSVSDCVITDCEVGIDAWAGAVERCTVAGSTTAGVMFRSGVAIRANTFTACAFGVRGAPATNGRSVIDSNAFLSCSVGIEALAGSVGNTITRNTFQTTTITPLSIGPGNNAAPLVASPAGAGPWDNIAF